ncbi:Uncharacterised protein [Salmonella enterica subsp. enterica]|nr:Uncharacterised protein [Salmonella enterica subsp. enterica]
MTRLLLCFLLLCATHHIHARSQNTQKYIPQTSIIIYVLKSQKKFVN